MSYQQPQKTIYLTHLKCFLEAQFHIRFVETGILKKCMSVTAFFPDRQNVDLRNKMLLHVSYSYHAYLESRPKIKKILPEGAWVNLQYFCEG